MPLDDAVRFSLDASPRSQRDELCEAVSREDGGDGDAGNGPLQCPPENARLPVMSARFIEVS
jgi:hypothetical protein